MAYEKPAGRPCITIPLNQDIDQVAVLVDGPPQVVAFASDLHEDLVQVPDIAQRNTDLSCGRQEARTSPARRGPSYHLDDAGEGRGTHGTSIASVGPYWLARI